MTKQDLADKLERHTAEIRAGIKLANKALATLEEKYWEEHEDIEKQFHQVVGDLDEASSWLSEVTDSLANEWKSYSDHGFTCGYCGEPHEVQDGDDTKKVSHKSCAVAMEAGY